MAPSQTWHRVISARKTLCHVWHRFLTPYLAPKRCRTLFLQSIAQLRQSSLQLVKVVWSMYSCHGEKPNWYPGRFVCLSWPTDCSMKICKLLHVRHCVKKRWQTFHIRLSFHWLINAMSGIVFLRHEPGVKMLTNFIPAITCPTSANEISTVEMT